jgi:hypothetical protein
MTFQRYSPRSSEYAIDQRVTALEGANNLGSKLVLGNSPSLEVHDNHGHDVLIVVRLGRVVFLARGHADQISA